jgi:polyisoprenoid-binding protein YceI
MIKQVGDFRMRVAFRRALVPALLVLSVFFAVSQVSAEPYKVDKSHSFVHFEVTHLGIFPYPGRFKKFRMKLDYDTQNVENSKVEVDIPLESVETDDGLMNEALLGEQFFDVQNFPKMTFESTSIRKTSETTGIIEGDLTMHGYTHTVAFDAKINGVAKSPFSGKPIIGITAVAELERAKWGLAAWRPFVGSVVKIRIGFEASPE